MHAGDGEDETVRDNEIPTTAAGLPWWNGVGAAKTEKPVYGQLATDVPVASKAVTFVLPSHVQHSQPQVLAQTELDNQEGRKPTSSSSQPLPAQPGFDENGQDEHLRQQQGTAAGIPPPPGEYILPHTQLGLGQSLVQTAYPYADPYFGGIVAAYGAQAMIHPHMLGVQQARMPLPSEMVEEEPVYVNAKQYHGILRRRQIRAKAESENKLIKTRKPYLHESRHQHALKRARGCGGRFLNTKSKDESTRGSPNCFRSLDRPSLQAPTTTEAKSSLPGQGILISGFGAQDSGRSPPAVGSMTQSANAGNDTNLSSHLNSSTGAQGNNSSNNHQNQSFNMSAFHSLPEGFDGGQSAQTSNMVAAGAQQKAVATQ